MTTYRKKLVEVALPLEAINKAAVRENYNHGNSPPLHKWRMPAAGATLSGDSAHHERDDRR